MEVVQWVLCSDRPGGSPPRASPPCSSSPGEPSLRPPPIRDTRLARMGSADSCFPHAGNGGYDVTHYDLALDYLPPVATVPATPIGQIREPATPGCGDDRSRRGAGPRSLQPRPARHERVGLDDQRQACGRRRATCGRGRGRGCGVLAGPGRRHPEVGAHRPAPTEARRPASRLGSSSPTAARHARPTDIEDALYGWVTTRDGAMVVGEPEGIDDLVPGQRPSRRTRPRTRFEITVPEGKIGGGQRPPGAGTR